MPARRTESFGDPIGSYSFKLEVDGQVVGSFRQVEGISAEGDWETPPATRRAKITLKKGYASSPLLHHWRKSFLKGREGRKSGSITALNKGGQAVAKVSFFEAWPCRLTGLRSSLDGKGSDILMEEVVIAVEKIERG